MSKGNAKERRKMARAEQFGPPGATQSQEREGGGTEESGRSWGGEQNASRAGVRENQHTDIDRRQEGTLSRAQAPDIGAAGKREPSK